MAGGKTTVFIHQVLRLRKKTKKEFVLFAYAFFALTLCFAQQYNFKHYTTKNGLPNPFINHIYCDNVGYLWLSTQGGLSRFDGKEFLNYTANEGLPGSDVLCTTQDKNGNLWIGTNGFGVTKFANGKFSVLSEKDGLCNNYVYAIVNDSQNNLWFVTQGGLSKYNGSTFTNYTIKNGLPTNLFFSACLDKKGNIWFGSKDCGPIQYNGKHFERIDANNALYKLSVFSLHCDNKGQLWAGTTGNGLWIQNGNVFSQFDDTRLNHEFISAIREDKHHNTWIATDNQLVKINGSRKQYYTVENGLTSNTIYSLGFDGDGKLWVGTINGLNVLVNEAFVNFNEANGLSNNNITVFCRDKDGDLLIGTAGGGLNVYNEKGIHHLNIPALNHANILCLTKTVKGEVVVGLNNSDVPLVVLEKKNDLYVLKKQIANFNGKAFSTVTGLVQTLANNLYVATYGNGLWEINNNTCTQLLPDSLLFAKDIMTLFMDSKHNLWISIHQRGVIHYDFKTVQTYNTKNGLGDNTVLSICEDQNHNIVFGNYENGITIFNGTTFVTHNKKGLFPSNNVQALSCDRNNTLWVGTNKGLAKVKLNNTLNITTLKKYNEYNGLLGTEINQGALYCDVNNTLWIGSNEGLTKYHSFYDYRNTIPPKIVLHTLKLNYTIPNWQTLGVPYNAETKLPVHPTLNYNNNHLTFGFKALTIDGVLFTYMLEGFDQHWTPLRTKTEADYTNIPPGIYTFKARAINSDGVWSKEPIRFSFTIYPPFWQTWWFRICLTIFMLALVWTIFKWRTTQLAKEKKLLEHKVNERTQELSVANAHLSVALHDIKDSILYAQKIQHSILPNPSEFKLAMNNAFVLFMPKDIVSGDFYWVGKKNNMLVYATCDCTGHGVPGGFMTMLGTSFLNEIIDTHNAAQPHMVMDTLREKIIDALKQTGVEGENKDGMDMVLCALDTTNLTLHYGAANNSFYVVRNGTLHEMKADKQPIGYFSTQTPFTAGKFQLQHGDVVYTFTDGYADQFGGPNGKKFKYKQFEELLTQIWHLPMQEQHEKLHTTILNWMGEYEQLDDILIIGYCVSN